MRSRTRGPAWLPVFGLVFPTIVGGGILALPIALDPLGPRAGVLAALAIGLVNVVSGAALAMAMVRFSRSTPRTGRLAAVVGAHIGPRVAVTTAFMVGIYVLGLVVIYPLGLSQSLASLTALSAPAWALIVLAVCGVVVLVQARKAVMISGTVVSFINLALLAILVVMIGSHMRVEYLTAEPAQPLLSKDALLLAFGALIFASFGHTTIPSVAVDSLRVDPSGRALVRGCVLAGLAATALNSLWVLVTLGSTPAGTFNPTETTGILQIQAIVGPVGGALATTFVILSLGGGALVSSFVAGDLAVERLPVLRELDVNVERGTLIEATDAPEGQHASVEIAWGLHGALVARARRAHVMRSVDITDDSWDAGDLLEAVGGARAGRWLHLQVVERTPAGVRLHIRTTMSARVARRTGSATTRLLDDDPRVAGVIRDLTREPQTAAALAATMGEDERAVTSLLETLAAAGAVDQAPDGTWRPRLGSRHHSSNVVTAALASSYGDEPLAVAAPGRAPSWLSSPVAARIVGTLPTIIALVLVLALLASNSSFASLLSLLGLAVAVFISITIALLLGIASFRGRDTRGPRSLWVPRPIVLWAIMAAMLAICAAYALWIYSEPAQRLVAGAGVAVSLYAVWRAWRDGALAPSSVLVLAVGPDRDLTAELLADGRPQTVQAPSSVPAAGQDFDVTLPDGILGVLRVVTRTDGNPADALGSFRLSWTGGSIVVEDPPPPEGLIVPVSEAAGPVLIRWTAT